ncbi:MAG: hypothetical protein AB7H77_05465, partial [Bdellovibrionales bacterium]
AERPSEAPQPATSAEPPIEGIRTAFAEEPSALGPQDEGIARAMAAATGGTGPSAAEVTEEAAIESAVEAAPAPHRPEVVMGGEPETAPQGIVPLHTLAPESQAMPGQIETVAERITGELPGRVDDSRAIHERGSTPSPEGVSQSRLGERTKSSAPAAPGAETEEAQEPSAQDIGFREAVEDEIADRHMPSQPQPAPSAEASVPAQDQPTDNTAGTVMTSQISNLREAAEDQMTDQQGSSPQPEPASRAKAEAQSFQQAAPVPSAGENPSATDGGFREAVEDEIADRSITEEARPEQHMRASHEAMPGPESGGTDASSERMPEEEAVKSTTPHPATEQQNLRETAEQAVAQEETELRRSRETAVAAASRNVNEAASGTANEPVQNEPSPGKEANDARGEARPHTQSDGDTPADRSEPAAPRTGQPEASPANDKANAGNTGEVDDQSQEPSSDRQDERERSAKQDGKNTPASRRAPSRRQAGKKSAPGRTRQATQAQRKKSASAKNNGPNEKKYRVAPRVNRNPLFPHRPKTQYIEDIEPEPE